ncbi:MAG: hydrogenase maturation nickel metallochaperone HypA [Firmicutes bacterium]|nr:hydrogenase maturation nickel metallochaperone HypA [Bacillota bacterium]
MSIAVNIFRIIREKLKEMYSGYYPVKKVRVVVGKMSTVVPEALEFCFQSAGCGTIFDGAKFELVEIPMKIACQDCKEEMAIDEPFLFCRKCESFNVEVVSGRELYVDTFEIDEDAGIIETDRNEFE